MTPEIGTWTSILGEVVVIFVVLDIVTVVGMAAASDWTEK